MSKRFGLTFKVGTPLNVRYAGLFIAKGSGSVGEKALKNTYTLMFVRRGQLSIQVDTAQMRLDAGQVLLVCPWQRFRGGDDSSDDLRLYWVNFELGSGRMRASADSLFIGPISEVTRADRVTELFRLLLDDNSAGLGNQTPAKTLLTTILCEIAESAKLMETSPKSVSAIAERGRNFIRLHFDEQISTSGIAKALDCSPGYLCHAFKDSAGITPMEFLHQTRLHHACNLLAESEQSIGHVAHQCGFQDEGYFRRVFSRAIGMSPRQYRLLNSRAYTVSEL